MKLSANSGNAATAISPSTSAIGPVSAIPGVGSTIVIASCTTFLMLASTAALWAKVEPVIVLVARYTG